MFTTPTNMLVSLSSYHFDTAEILGLRHLGIPMEEKLSSHQGFQRIIETHANRFWLIASISFININIRFCK